MQSYWKNNWHTAPEKKNIVLKRNAEKKSKLLQKTKTPGILPHLVVMLVSKIIPIPIKLGNVYKFAGLSNLYVWTHSKIIQENYTTLHGHNLNVIFL